MWSPEQLQAIESMLNPRSIAVVGATPKSNYGGRFLTAALKSQARVPVFPVNPNHTEIMGVRCYSSLAELPEAPDTVGIVVPYEQVLDVLKQCHASKAGSAIVISAGFAERGTEVRRAMQDQLVEFARSVGLRMAGPNCLGIANVKRNIWATATSKATVAPAGHIALISQSGASAFGPFMARAIDSGIGFSYIVSTGNEADLDFTDYARYVLDDPDTRVVAGFVEGFKSVPKFLALAELAAQRAKPLVVVKIGRSAPGAAAARSHTAALTGVDALCDAVFKQYGVIRVRDYDELLETSQLLALAPKPRQRGVAVISHSGGIASLSADLCGDAGLELPPLSAEAKNGLDGVLKGAGSAANPADVTGYARGDLLAELMRHMLDQPDIGTLVIASAGAAKQAQHVVDLRRSSDKCIAFLWVGSRSDSEALAQLKGAAIPVFYSPETMARALKAMLDYHRWRERHMAAGEARPEPINGKQAQIRERLRSAMGTRLTEFESKRVIAAWNVPIARELLATTLDEALQAAQSIGYPVALKVSSPDISHKTEAGGVRLNVRDTAELRIAYEEIVRNASRLKAATNSVLVQEMIGDATEVIVGVSEDAQLGPMLMLGIGGVMVEVYNDVAFRRCPITRAMALDMVSELKGAPVLRGFRGRAPGDIEALADVLVRVSRLAADLEGTLAELDINPVMVLPAGQGAKAVDALLVLRQA